MCKSTATDLNSEELGDPLITSLGDEAPFKHITALENRLFSDLVMRLTILELQGQHSFRRMPADASPAAT